MSLFAGRNPRDVRSGDVYFSPEYLSELSIAVDQKRRENPLVDAIHSRLEEIADMERNKALPKDKK